MMAQLLLALDLIHRKGIIHRDIKTDNILIINEQDLSVCITDLGMACLKTDDEELKMKCGSPGFVAPEILKNEKATTQSDIFSLGSIFYRLLTGVSLFRGHSAKEVLSNNKYQHPDSIIDQTMSTTDYSPLCIDLLKNMLNPDPLYRYTAEQCLKHAWFAKDKDALEKSLLLNKNHNLLSTFIRSSNPTNAIEGVSSKEFESFFITPNYYAMFE